MTIFNKFYLSSCLLFVYIVSGRELIKGFWLIFGKMLSLDLEASESRPQCSGCKIKFQNQNVFGSKSGSKIDTSTFFRMFYSIEFLWIWKQLANHMNSAILQHWLPSNSRKFYRISSQKETKNHLQQPYLLRFLEFFTEPSLSLCICFT